MPTKSKRKLLHKLEYLRKEQLRDIYTGRTQNRNRHERNLAEDDKCYESDFIEDPIELIEYIKSCKNHYTILNVSRKATIPEIKKAYKRLALRLHPDKNDAPDAAEAFKIVTNAVNVLTDENNRLVYNRQLDIEQQNLEFFESQNKQDEYHKRNRTPGEMFFSHTFDFDRRCFYNPRQQQTIFTDAQLLTMGIVIAFIFAIALAFLSFTQGGIYSLTASRKYCVSRETEKLSIPYYVTKTFYQDFKGSVHNLEQSIERYYVDTMKHNCRSEHNLRESLIQRAQKFGSIAQLENAKLLSMPSCERLHKIEQGIRS